MDMFSINIQRGRDNGVSPYINWRKICKLTPVTTWSDLENIMRPSSLRVLKNTYQLVFCSTILKLFAFPLLNCKAIMYYLIM